MAVGTKSYKTLKTSVPKSLNRC
uniref:Uncharacterized protein n=1 Tax=Anguilla anguilla TaxID=7936 RepID=A0A0E9UTM1_ANGAN